MKALFFLLVLWPYATFAQSFSDIEKAVGYKDFGALRKLLGHEAASMVSVPIANNYEWYYLTTYLPKPGEDYYGVDAILSGNIIVFANISQIEAEGKLASLSDTLSRKPLLDCYIKNDPEYNHFIKAHSLYYGFGFNPSNFDKDKDWIWEPYGASCGFGGTNPWSRIQVDSVVAAGNDALLNVWLHSYMPALQAYAVEGFYKLHGSTCGMTEEQLRLIKLIKKSGATVATCGGCFFSSQPLKEALANYNFYCSKQHNFQ